MAGDPGTLKHPLAVSDYADLENYARITQLPTGTAAAQTAALPEGIYDVWCSADTFVKIAPAASTGLTTATGYLIRANQTVSVFVRNNSKIGAILTTGTGTLDAHKVG